MKDEVLVSSYLNRLPDTEQPIIHLVCKIEAALDTSNSLMSNPLSSSLRQRRVPQATSSTFLASTPNSTNVLNANIPTSTCMYKFCTIIIWLAFSNFRFHGECRICFSCRSIHTKHVWFAPFVELCKLPTRSVQCPCAVRQRVHEPIFPIFATSLRG